MPTCRILLIDFRSRISLASTVPLYVCPVPRCKLVLHSAHRPAADCSRTHDLPPGRRAGWTACSATTAGCMRTRLAVAHLTVPVPELHNGGVERQQHPLRTTHPQSPISSICACGYFCLRLEAGPDPTGCGYLTRGSADANRGRAVATSSTG